MTTLTYTDLDTFLTAAEELGYFKFGGSTLLLLFEPGQMRYDDDLVDNSRSALETLVSALTCYNVFFFTNDQ